MRRDDTAIRSLQYRLLGVDISTAEQTSTAQQRLWLQLYSLARHGRKPSTECRRRRSRPRCCRSSRSRSPLSRRRSWRNEAGMRTGEPSCFALCLCASHRLLVFYDLVIGLGAEYLRHVSQTTTFNIRGAGAVLSERFVTRALDIGLGAKMCTGPVESLWLVAVLLSCAAVRTGNGPGDELLGHHSCELHRPQCDSATNGSMWRCP